MTMADTIAVMNKGPIEQIGAPARAHELPKTAFVANFLGQSNLFTGTVASPRRARRIRREIAGSGGGGAGSARRHAGHVTIGVRPEKLAPTTRPPSTRGQRARPPARVNDVSFTG